ncbi:MAG TPA: carbon-nitrogen family hydrolase [Synergistales bacterium]|mgnify:FL=1|nr:carbon-nitrogen family hydrolase [Synergistales bacterium]
MKVSSIQLEMKDDRSKEETIEYALAMMDKASGSDLIILPEIWNIGFFAYDKYISESEPIDGPTAAAISRKAKEMGAYVYSGSFVEKRDGKYYNTSILFDRQGKNIGEYRKIHLFSYKSQEPEILTPGREITVLDTEFGKVGLSTCYDLRFPELYRAMVDKGAEFFLVTSGWPFPRLSHWLVFNQARAIENTCFLISCNASGVQKGNRFLGHSQIVDPWGVVVAGSAHEERIIRAEIDPALVSRTRQEFPALKDRVL